MQKWQEQAHCSLFAFILRYTYTAFSCLNWSFLPRNCCNYGVLAPQRGKASRQYIHSLPLHFSYNTSLLYSSLSIVCGLQRLEKDWSLSAKLELNDGPFSTFYVGYVIKGTTPTSRCVNGAETHLPAHARLKAVGVNTTSYRVSDTGISCVTCLSLHMCCLWSVFDYILNGGVHWGPF